MSTQNCQGPLAVVDASGRLSRWFAVDGCLPWDEEEKRKRTQRLQRTSPLCSLSFFFFEVALLFIDFYLFEPSLLCCAMWQLVSALLFSRGWFEVI